MTTRLVALATLATLVWTGTAAGQEYIQIPNGAWATDITPDGTVVVGYGAGGGFYWRWQDRARPDLHRRQRRGRRSRTTAP